MPGLEVGLHVAVEVQMISAEVGEGCDIKGDRIGAAEHQGVEETSIITVSAPSSSRKASRP